MVSTNIGRNTKKNTVSFGFNRFTSTAPLITLAADLLLSDSSPESGARMPVCCQVPHAMYSRYATPSHLIASNATGLAAITAAAPVSASTRCGTIPSVHPSAATSPARVPRPRPAAIVNNAPVPGVAVTTIDAIQNSTPTRPDCRATWITTQIQVCADLLDQSLAGLRGRESVGSHRVAMLGRERHPVQAQK